MPGLEGPGKRKCTMTYLRAQHDICNHYLDHTHEEASWPAIVELIFDVIAHRDRLALKRRALGRKRRRLARKQKQGVAR
jgi:hypothetical protein